MKQKDWVVIGIVIVISGALSFIVSSKVISTKSDREVEVKKVEAISTEFTRPSNQYFNDQSVNPTETITIGPGQNADNQTQEQR